LARGERALRYPPEAELRQQKAEVQVPGVLRERRSRRQALAAAMAVAAAAAKQRQGADVQAEW